MRKTIGSSVSNNKGQFLIEGVLIMVLTTGIFMMAVNKLRDSKALSTMIGGPWSKVSGMLESGVWDTPDAARKKHPNQTERIISLDPGSL